MSPGRIEHTLDTYQPEEQHGFRSKYRLEEHLLTANLVPDKATAHRIPVWLVSVDLSKAFDHVHWPTLWNALRAQCISDHMIWMLSKLYESQSGEALGKWGSSRNFSITSGVRQGCVLSPRLFSAVLQLAMKSWRRDASLKGFDLGDGQPALLDLRFADDILLFAKSYAETVSLLHDLVTALSQVGSILNAKKTVVLTNEAQPPQHLQLPSGARHFWRTGSTRIDSTRLVQPCAVAISGNVHPIFVTHPHTLSSKLWGWGAYLLLASVIVN